MSDRRAIVLGLWLLLPACSSSSPLDDAPSSEAEPEHATLLLSPDPELYAVTRDWASKWSAATGLPVLVGPGGLPLFAADRVTNDGAEVCGTTTITDGVPVEIQIDMTPPDRCVGWGYMVGHEIGHALAGDPGHEDDGLMAQKPALGVQLTVDADYVCDRVGCPSP